MPSEIWFTGNAIPMEQCLPPRQQDAVKAFLNSLLWAKGKTDVSVSRFMLLYRKERNGGLFRKDRGLQSSTRQP